MPTSSKTICTYPGCTTLVLRGRCSRHAYERKPESRDGATKRGYDSSWRDVRKRYLARHPLCAYNRKCRPGTRATEVDHLLPIQQGGTSEWHNLRAACKACHSSKTARLDTNRDRSTGQFAPHT